jgi:SAM-dependent methyltransferase
MDQKEEKAWFQDWFSSPYYGMLYLHRNDHEAHFLIQNLVEKSILKRGEAVLDLACGNGRHSRYLAEMGLKVSGIDLSPEQIAEAKEQSSSEILYYVGDMRSFSLGIADSVTVLAATAAQAEVAATLIANVVNLDHPAIVRRPANSLRDDTDLGDRMVTVGVPDLAPAQIEQALQLGLDCAYAMQARGQIFAAFLCCQGLVVVAQPMECLV